jgi:hypothetical protein
MRTETEPRHPNLLLPLHCINAQALYSLARVLDRLNAFHSELNGTPPDRPCLKQLWVADEKHIHARVQSGTKTFTLELVDSEWVFR